MVPINNADMVPVLVNDTIPFVRSTTCRGGWAREAVRQSVVLRTKQHADHLLAARNSHPSAADSCMQSLCMSTGCSYVQRGATIVVGR